MRKLKFYVILILVFSLALTAVVQRRKSRLAPYYAKLRQLATVEKADEEYWAERATYWAKCAAYWKSRSEEFAKGYDRDASKEIGSPTWRSRDRLRMDVSQVIDEAIVNKQRCLERTKLHAKRRIEYQTTMENMTNLFPSLEEQEN